MFERFTPRARQAIDLAADEADALHHDHVGTEHLLLGLLRVPKGIAALALVAHGVTYDKVKAEVDAADPRPVDAGALAAVGIDLDEVRRAADEAFGPGALDRAMAGRRSGGGRKPFTPQAKKALALALREALALFHNYIGTEHLLLGIMRGGDGLGAQIVERLAPDADLKGTMLDLLRQVS